jgi:hypothetical protein
MNQGEERGTRNSNSNRSVGKEKWLTHFCTAGNLFLMFIGELGILLWPNFCLGSEFPS